MWWRSSKGRSYWRAIPFARVKLVVQQAANKAIEVLLAQDPVLLHLFTPVWQALRVGCVAAARTACLPGC